MQEGKNISQQNADFTNINDLNNFASYYAKTLYKITRCLVKNEKVS